MFYAGASFFMFASDGREHWQSHYCSTSSAIAVSRGLNVNASHIFMLSTHSITTFASIIGTVAHQAYTASILTMKHAVQLAEEFGPRLSDGAEAYAFRMNNLDRYISMCDEITLDFTGVRIANSSFINALVSGLITDHGEQILEKLIFKSCLPTVRVLVEAGIDLGLSKIAEQPA